MKEKKNQLLLKSQQLSTVCQDKLYLEGGSSQASRLPAAKGCGSSPYLCLF